MTKGEAKTISAAHAARIERRMAENIQRAALNSAALAAAKASADGMPKSSIRYQSQVARLPGSDLAFEVEVWACTFGAEEHIARDEQEALTWVHGRKAMWHSLHARGRARAILGKRLCDLAARVTAAVEEAQALCAEYTTQDLLSVAEEQHISDACDRLRICSFAMPEEK